MAPSDFRRSNPDEDSGRLRARLASLERAEAAKDAFVRLSRWLAGATTAEAVMDAVREVSDQLLSWDFFYLAHRLPGEDQFHVVSVIDTVDGRKQAFPGYDSPLSEFSEPVREVLAGRPLLINRSTGELLPRMVPLGTGRLSASLMFVPVRRKGCAIGLVSIQSYTPGRYGESDLQLLQDMADVLAPALERMRAEESLSRSQELLRLERDLLEQRVRDRTAELVEINRRLLAEITEREKAERDLRESEQRLRILNENLAEGMVYQINSGPDGRQRQFTYLSPAVERLHGLKVEDVLRNPLLLYDQVVEEDRATLAEREAQAHATRTTLDIDLRVRLPSGDIRWRRFVSSPRAHPDGSIVWDGIELDISKRKRAEEALRRKEDELRRLTVEANCQLEEERKHISRELHDELGQMLTALNLNLAWLSRRTDGGDSAASDRLQESVEYVSRMIDSVRSLSRTLRPVALSHEGLVEAVRAHASEFEQYSGITCKVQVVPPDLEVGEPVATVAFRIVQEALTNVARHSGGTRCSVTIESDADTLVLRVQDNGIGLASKHQKQGRSLGIPGMSERAAIIGGHLTVEDNPGGGVCVLARLPLDPEHTFDQDA